MRSSDKYQIALIVSGLVAAAMFAVFLYREIFPEYKIYQKDYVALEEFRSTYTGEPPAPFQLGVKQIVIPREDNGPPTIDRCVSCHVALQISDYSPTKLARDINGNPELDAEGNPVLTTNENYVWARLDAKINELRDQKTIEELRAKGQEFTISSRLKEANRYESLKTAQVGEHVYDVTKVLAMHPLIGKETRPFEFHSIDEYGCVSCHNGNGRALTTDKAHGPIFDGQYEPMFMGYEPKFTETDPDNDPAFAHMFNHKPGDALLFQTSPLFLGSLIEAKCIQCHQSSATALQGAVMSASVVTKYREKRALSIKQAYINERNALASLMTLQHQIKTEGLEKTIQQWKKQSEDYTLPALELSHIANQLKVLQNKNGETEINQQILNIVGSAELVQELQKEAFTESDKQSLNDHIDAFVTKHLAQAPLKAPLFDKAAAWNLEQELMQHVSDTEESLKKTVGNTQFMSAITTDLDVLTQEYAKGQQLYISQACYACHRISGFARGGVGPELTHASKTDPWYLKESIVWPQADLPTSTMPNFKLDHDSVEKLMTFLLGQTGQNRAISDTAYKIALQEWEAGRKSAWEKPISPAQMLDLHYAMTIFATQGCSACHRLRGFESNVGLAIEKDKNSNFDTTYQEHQWFSKLFPEEVLGSQIVSTIEQHAEEIDKRIVNGVRENSLLEEIEESAPGQIEALYSNFAFAARAKNQYYEQLITSETNEEKKNKLSKELQEWKERIHRILMVYIQEYGLGRLIGPRPNWSGVFRSDQWLMEHFRNPTSHVPRSIMPVFPFDDTKFYALTHMLDVLGIRNRDAVRTLWQHKGFDPALAAHIYCSQCHGEFLIGNGPVSEWIYPIPKNLRNPDFLRNMTKENIINSITHGVSGTPMPPWGEIAKDKPTADGIPVLTKGEIQALADWLFSAVPGGNVIKQSQDVPKWQYGPNDVIEELHKEKGKLEESQEEHPTHQKEVSLQIDEDLDAVAMTSLGEVHDRTSEVFHVLPNPLGHEKHAYYIKQKFYTDQNIERGKAFFEHNCAVCHGNEADGSGIRSSLMQDAKPRMLTNLDWLSTHDDIYLLRSIKYGVPGTSMTPWGDLTSSLQRLQLVIFIRSLAQNQTYRDHLLATLYKSFDTQLLLIERARGGEYQTLEKYQAQFDELQIKQKAIAAKAQTDQSSQQPAVKAYEATLSAQTKINKQQAVDSLFVQLKEEIKKEQELYKLLGLDLLSLEFDDHSIQEYMNLISLYENRYAIQNNHLAIQEDGSRAEKIASISKKLIATTEERLNKLMKESELLQGKFASSERSEELSHLTAEINRLTKFKRSMIATFSLAAQTDKKQKELVDQINQTLITQEKNSQNG